MVGKLRFSRKTRSKKKERTDSLDIDGAALDGGGGARFISYAIVTLLDRSVRRELKTLADVRNDEGEKVLYVV